MNPNLPSEPFKDNLYNESLQLRQWLVEKFFTNISFAASVVLVQR
jgi:hypothetical protein